MILFCVITINIHYVEQTFFFRKFTFVPISSEENALIDCSNISLELIVPKHPKAG